MLFHAIHPSHSHFRGSPAFQSLQFWDVATAESQSSFLMAEHCTSCTLLIQSNRNTVLQGHLTQDQSNEIIVPLSRKMALGWQFYIMKNMCWNNACEVNGSQGVRWGTVHFSREVFGWELELGLIVCPWVNKAIMGYWDCWLQTNNALCVSMTFYNH